MRTAPARGRCAAVQNGDYEPAISSASPRRPQQLSVFGDHNCRCGRYGTFGYQQLGRFFCAEHRPDKPKLKEPGRGKAELSSSVPASQKQTANEGKVK
jgi:hypothetical protein